MPRNVVSSRVADIHPPGAGWQFPRILYLFHPTDAIGTWTPAVFWRPPEWTSPPYGYGVPSRVRWFPIVTGVQEMADMMEGFSAVPGFGHDYTNSFAEAWSAVVPPAGWTDADTARLNEVVQKADS